MAASGFPISGYFFEVKMGNLDMAFKEVSGLSATIEYKQERPGGDSTTRPKKFDKITPGEVTFKKGLIKNTLLSKKVIEDVFGLKLNQVNNRIDHKNVLITLKNEKEAVAYFMLTDAFPTKWEISNFDAMSKEIVIETIVLGCDRIYADYNVNWGG